MPQIEIWSRLPAALRDQRIVDFVTKIFGDLQRLLMRGNCDRNRRGAEDPKNAQRADHVLPWHAHLAAGNGDEFVQYLHADYAGPPPAAPRPVGRKDRFAQGRRSRRSCRTTPYRAFAPARSKINPAGKGSELYAGEPTHALCCDRGSLRRLAHAQLEFQSDRLLSVRARRSPPRASARPAYSPTSPPA